VSPHTLVNIACTYFLTPRRKVAKERKARKKDFRRLSGSERLSDNLIWIAQTRLRFVRAWHVTPI